MNITYKEQLSKHVENIFMGYSKHGLHICDIATGGGKSYTIGKLTCQYYPEKFDRIVILCVQNKLVNSMNREKMLKQVLEGAKREYDYILLDCMPSLGMLTINALAAADAALIPVQAQYLSAKGLEQLLQTVQKVRRQINPKLKIEGILLTMTDSRTNYGKQISNLIRQAYGKHLKVFEQTIPRSVRAAETSAAGKSIFAYDPKGKVAEAYKSLAKEVLADADRQWKLSSERAR